VNADDTSGLMTPAEVAATIGVPASTIRSWEERYSLGGSRTPGGHRRYRAAEVYALLAGSPTQAD